jgi:hypothetical protein
LTAGWAIIRGPVPRCGQVAVCTMNGWHKKTSPGFPVACAPVTRLTARPHSHVRFIGRRAAGLGRDGLQGFCILVVLLQTLAAAPAEFAVYQLVLERRFPRVSHPAGGRTWSGPDRGR